MGFEFDVDWSVGERERAVVQLEVDNQASTQDHLSDFNFLHEHFQKIFNIFQHKYKYK